MLPSLTMVLGVTSRSSTKASHKRGHGSTSAASVASRNASNYNLGSTPGSSSSRHVHRFSSSVSRATGRTTPRTVSLNPTGILKQQKAEETAYLSRIEGMTSTQLEGLHTAAMICDYSTIPARSPSPAIAVHNLWL